MPRRRIASLVPRGALLAALALLLPAAARAVAPPPPELLPVLAARCDSAGRTRIATGHATRFAERVRFESDAVLLAGPRRVAILEFGTPPEKVVTRIPWAEVESLSAGRSRAAAGLLTGSLLGALAGGALVGTFGTDIAESGDHGVLYFGVAVGVGCALLGALVGAGHYHWTQLYP